MWSVVIFSPVVFYLGASVAFFMGRITYGFGLVFIGIGVNLYLILNVVLSVLVDVREFFRGEIKERETEDEGVL